MPASRCTRGALWRGGAACLIAALATGAPLAQDAPPRRDVTIVARDFRFSPDRVDVDQGDLIRLVVRSEDVAYGFTIDEYRISRRVPAGGETTFQFQADRAGTFPYYSNLTSHPEHAQARGTLIVRGRR